MQTHRYLKTVIYIFVILIITSCAKKEDLECRTEIYTPTSTSIETTIIKDKIKTDADRECGEFGKSHAGANGTYDCNLR